MERIKCLIKKAEEYICCILMIALVVAFLAGGPVLLLMWLAEDGWNILDVFILGTVIFVAIAAFGDF